MGQFVHLLLTHDTSGLLQIVHITLMRPLTHPPTHRITCQDKKL